MKFKSLGLIAVALGFGAAGIASAHTISIGVYNAGAPGSVTLAMGTYSHGTPIFEGSMALIAGPVTTGPVAFSSVATIKPTGLIDGVNNFYIDQSAGVADAYTLASNTTGLAVANWQELTFTGLTAGTYTYQLSGFNSVNWQNWNTNGSNWTGTIVITDTVANVPEPGTLALLGLGLAGLGLSRRRKIH